MNTETSAILATISTLLVCISLFLILNWYNFKFHARRWRVVRDNGIFYVERMDAWIWFRHGGAYDAGFPTLDEAIKDAMESREKWEKNIEIKNLDRWEIPL